jgi:TPR repeat protein
MRTVALAILLIHTLASVTAAPPPSPAITGEKPYIASLRARARRGDAQAQFDLGACYRFGQGVPKNEVEAVRWYRKAADQGYDKAQYNLGVCYDAGTGVAKDHEEAARWYRRAAYQGHGKAAYNLAVDYKYGQGVERDDAEAWAWFDMAAGLGEARAAASRDELGKEFGPETLQRARERKMALEATVKPRPVRPVKKVPKAP